MQTINAAASTAATAPKGWKVSTNGRSMTELSRQWISRPADEKFLSLDALLAATKARAEATQELKISAREIEIFSPSVVDGESRKSVVAKQQQLFFGLPGGREVAPSNWAFGQVAGLAKAPASYLRRLPSTIVADAIQYDLRYNAASEDVKLFVDEAEALAVTGPDYGRIFNWECAEAVQMMTEGGVGDHRWKVPGVMDWGTLVYNPHVPVSLDTTTLFANDRGIFVFLCQDLAPIEIGKLKDGSPDLVFRGFYLTNSEVGAGALKIGAMYLRAICQNRILWGVEAFEEMTMRHTKYAPARFLEEARPVLKSFGEGSTQKLIEGVRAAREATVADSKAEAVAWLTGRDVARKRALAILDKVVAEERGGDEDDTSPFSAWEIAQGITAAARDEQNHDTRMEMEKLGRSVLDKVTG